LNNLSSKIFLVLCAVGIIDAILTAIEYTTPGPGNCTINAVISCVPVKDSGYTSIAGIPFWVAGLIWFPLLLVLGLILTKGGTWRLREDVLLPLLMVGNLFTVYLWYLELVKIHAVCPYCVSLYSVNYVLTAIVAYEWLR
jgi:uncharacterized membrane protein